MGRNCRLCAVSSFGSSASTLNLPICSLRFCHSTGSTARIRPFEFTVTPCRPDAGFVLAMMWVSCLKRLPRSAAAAVPAVNFFRGPRPRRWSLKRRRHIRRAGNFGCPMLMTVAKAKARLALFFSLTFISLNCFKRVFWRSGRLSSHGHGDRCPGACRVAGPSDARNRGPRGGLRL